MMDGVGREPVAGSFGSVNENDTAPKRTRRGAEHPAASTDFTAEQQKNLPMSWLAAIARTASRGPHASLALRCGYRLCCNLRISGTDSRAAALRLFAMPWST